MGAKPPKIYQIKITLLDIKPPVWRRILIPASATFWDLHVAIQDAMGWEDSHLHEFTGPDRRAASPLRIGIPGDEPWAPDEAALKPGWTVTLSQHLKAAAPKLLYTYDFGDDWEHEILLEKVLPVEPGATYPQCIAGRRACPPEDVGGPWGYARYLEAIANPSQPEHKELVEWRGPGFEPEKFDPSGVRFSDAQGRLGLLLG